MAQQTINVGTTANDGTGDNLRGAMIKVNENFDELYDSVGTITSPMVSTFTDLTINMATYTDNVLKVTLTTNESFVLTNVPVAKPKSFLILASGDDSLVTIPGSSSHIVKGDREVVVADGTWCEVNLMYDGTLFFWHYVNGLTVGTA